MGGVCANQGRRLGGGRDGGGQGSPGGVRDGGGPGGTWPDGGDLVGGLVDMVDGGVVRVMGWQSGGGVEGVWIGVRG